MKNKVLSYAVSLLFVILALVSVPVANAAPGDLLLTVGDEHLYGEASGVATDKAGNLYVVDGANSKVMKFNSSRVLMASFGGYGTGDGQLDSPTGVAVDNNGYVYVADHVNSRVQKFDSAGNFVLGWQSGDQYTGPYKLAVDGNANVFVINGYNKVQKFNSGGQLLIEWGIYGSGNEQLTPSGIAVDGLGNVYVVDTYNYRIQKFDNNGNFIKVWGSFGSGNGQFQFDYYSSGVTVDGVGHVYVLDSERIQKFDSNGNFLASWQTVAKDVATNISGTVYIVFENEVTEYNSTGILLNRWTFSGAVSGQFNEPGSVNLDGQENLWVADTLNHRIQKFNSKGAFITSFGSYGSGDGKFSFPTEIAVDANGNLYVADSGNHRIQKFGSSGNFLLAWGVEGTGDGQFSGIAAVTIDKNNDIYVADQYEDQSSFDSYVTRIRKFEGTGRLLTTSSTQSSKSSGVNSLVVDRNDNIYLSCFNAYSPGYIRLLNSRGEYVSTLNMEVSNIAINSYGDFYTITGDGTAQPQGGWPVYLEAYDPAWILKGRLVKVGEWLPSSPVPPFPLSVNTSGSRVYVADIEKNIIKVYEGYAPPVAKATAINCGGPAFTDSTGQAFAADSLYSGGSTNTTTMAIPNTVNDKLYQSWRYGNMGYNIPVTNGNYNVTLKFSDWYTTVGKRVFDVKMEGTTVLSNFDIVAKAGYLNPYDVTIPVTVNDGILNIQFINRVDNAKINAILVKPVSTTTNYTITASAGAGGSISPTGSISVPSGTSKTFTVTPNTGYKISDVKVDGTPVGAVTTYTFNNVTANHIIEASFTAATTQSAIALNCGGPAFTDSTGQAFLTDTYYSGGYTNSTTMAIPGTVDDKLYQSWRYGNMNYNIPVANGSYNITLKFSDWYTTIGKRVFDVKMEGATVLSNFDIVAKAGYLNPYDVTIPVTVSDGTLNIQFVNKVDNAKINAILIKSNSNPPPILPPPWQTHDIGSVGVAGSASYSNGTFTLNGSGADIWGTSDSFRFVYQPLTGDGQIVARVASLQNTNAWAKTGVMIRESLAANSAHALMDIAISGAEFARRPSTGAATATTTVLGVIATPYWVKLVRSGSSLTGYISSDGSYWTFVGTQTINMANTVYVGLALTSHVNTVLATATLDGVAVTAGPSTSFIITTTAGIGGDIYPLGDISVPTGTDKTFDIIPQSGYKILDVKVDGISVGAVSSYTFSNVTANHTIAANFMSTLNSTKAAINCGGSAFTDSSGQSFIADTYYSGGYTNTTTMAIPNTVDDKLYQSWRYGNMSYSIPLASGNYNVILKFSDWYTTVGKRVFDVKMEGATVLSNFDIVAKAGYLNPYDVTIPVTVSDGTLNIQFVNKVDNAKINAIVVKAR